MACIVSRFSLIRLFPNLLTIQGPNLINRRSTKDLEQLKRLSLKIQELISNNTAITEKQEKQYVKQTYTSTRGESRINFRVKFYKKNDNIEMM